MRYLDELLATARRHRRFFDDDEIRALESWVEEMRSDPAGQEICEWLRFAAGAVIEGARGRVLT